MKNLQEIKHEMKATDEEIKTALYFLVCWSDDGIGSINNLIDIGELEYAIKISRNHQKIITLAKKDTRIA